MTIKLYAFTCGWLNMALDSMLPGENGQIRVPVPSFLIDHPKGRVLFDTGLHKSMQEDPSLRLGKFAERFGVEFQAGEDIAARLAQIDLDVSDVTYLVNSHLHFDHAGGNDAICDCPVVLQKPEWEAANDPDLARANGFSKRDFDHGQDMKIVSGEFDVFGDGSVVCIPTYGHTPGHQSLKVKLGSGEIVLAGDACYLRRSLEELRLPNVVHDKAKMLASFQRLRDLQARGARIFYGHDPEFWENVPQAPALVT